MTGLQQRTLDDHSRSMTNQRSYQGELPEYTLPHSWTRLSTSTSKSSRRMSSQGAQPFWLRCQTTMADVAWIMKCCQPLTWLNETSSCTSQGAICATLRYFGHWPGFAFVSGYGWEVERWTARDLRLRDIESEEGKGAGLPQDRAVSYIIAAGASMG